MPPINRLPDFRSLLSSSHPSQSPSTSTSTSSTTYPPRPTSPPANGSRLMGSAGRRKKRKMTEEEVRERKEEREFLEEGYSIHNHLSSLSTHLHLIRRAYLSTQPSTLSTNRDRDRNRIQNPSRAPTPIPNTTNTNGEPLDPEQARLRKLEKSRVLTDRERDEVDLRCRVVLMGCRERVGVLEVREKIRQNKAKPSTTTSLLTTLLPSLASTSDPDNNNAPTPQQKSTILTAHHASILWSLNNSMVKLSDYIRGMQEERGKIRDERGKSLGGMVGSGSGEGNVLTRRFGLGAGMGKGRVEVDGRKVELTVPTARIATNGDAVSGESSGSGTGTSSDGTVFISQQQQQLFSAENDALLSSMSSTLSTVLRAEQSLLEISQLQSTLITHLATQSEMIDQLYDEAIDTVADLDRANTQLKRARERGKEGRMGLLVFLVVASLALLFLDWYS